MEFLNKTFKEGWLDKTIALVTYELFGVPFFLAIPTAELVSGRLEIHFLVPLFLTESDGAVR